MTMILKRMHLNQVIMKNILILMVKIPRKREVISEKTVTAGKNLKVKMMREANSGYKPPVNIPETELELFQLFLLIIYYKKSLQRPRFQ
ncbi:hypothetical protein JTB14_020247 [Gonioctena quinquepunctata]|nr:hypothetical protein JTB14_020247 [Gonioctena quinquepunctata]